MSSRETFELFKAEEAMLETAKAQIADPALGADAHRQGFADLIDGYGKLLKTAKRLVRLSDRNEIDLRKAKAEAEAATRAKAVFLATMSHEIRTPMNGVVGMVDLLQETNLDADQRHMLGTVKDSAQALLQIINDILDFSKIEAGKLELESVPFSPGAVLEAVVRLLEPVAGERGVDIEGEIDPSLPPAVMGDPGRLRQILFNLAGNAVKFSAKSPPERGRVSLHAGRGETEPSIVFIVADNGIGMTAEVTEKVFTPFTQADGSTTRRFGGTGLGLSICRNLVDMMGGEIAVDSTPAVGTTVTVRIPLPETDAKPAALAEPRTGNAVCRRPVPSIDQAERDGRLVLLAEDNATNRDVISRQLASLGFACVVAVDGRDAFAAMHSRAVALVLTDCHMPEMDGFALCETIRGLEAGSGERTPVVAITASAMAEERERCFAAGMDEVLTKPLETAVLQNTLERFLPWPDGHADDDAPDAAEAQSGGAVDAPLDPAFLRRTFGDDPALIKALLTDFLDPAAEILGAFRDAVAAADGEGVRQAAHKLKSSARTVGADALADLCARLEKAGEAADWPTVAAASSALEAEADAVFSYIRNL